MPNSYYNHSVYPAPNSPGSSSQMRAELDLIAAGFNKLPTLTANGYKVVMVNAAGTALVASSSLQSLAITGSTIDATPIGATTRAAGNFTTLSATGAVNLGSAVTIAGGTINDTPIGNSTPSSGAFTTVSAASGFTGNLTGNVTGNLTGNVIGNVTGDLAGNVTTASGTSTFNNVTINGTLDMNAGSAGTITGLATPTNSSDAANKSYVDTANALKLNLSGGTMSGDIVMNSNRVTGLLDPSSNQDAATKAYVDSVAQGLSVKAAVVAATTGNITLSGTQTIDSVAVIAGDRVLVKDQSTAANNGIYVAASGAWTRSTDADTYAELRNAFVFVSGGTTNGNSGWSCTITAGGTLGTTAITFEQFSAAGQTNAGNGLTKTGNTIDVGTASTSRIVVNADNIDLATIGSAGTYRSVTVDAYGRVSAGTNPTTLSGYGITDAYTKTEVDTTVGTLLAKSGGTMSGVIAMGANKITGLADPTLAQDAVTLNYVTTLYGSTASAATSASNAATSATNAANSATTAATSATNSASSATTALGYLNTFRGQYIGAASSDPTVDGNGAALTAGDLYFNTTVPEMRVYSGSAWVSAYLPSSSYVTLTGAQTVTDKRITPRITTTASTTSPWAWNSDGADQFAFTALANDLTINADAGTPTNGQKIVFRFKDSGSARALTWTTGSTKAFRELGITLPTTTVVGKTTYVGCIFNSADNRWDAVATTTEV